MNSIPKWVRVLFVLLLGLIFLPRGAQAQEFPGTGGIQPGAPCYDKQSEIWHVVNDLLASQTETDRLNARLLYRNESPGNKLAAAEANLKGNQKKLVGLLSELARCNCPEKTGTPPTETPATPPSKPVEKPTPYVVEHYKPGEVFVGVQYQHAPKEPAKNLVGIDGQASYDFAKRIGIVADFAWTTGSDRIGTTTDVRVDRFTVLGGPKIKTKLFFSDRNSRGPSQGRGIQLFFQPLFGLAHDTIKFQSSTISTSSASTAFMASVGGGTEVMFKKNAGVRSEVDYQLTHFGGFWQNNIRIAAGIVFRFGKEKELPTW